MLAILTALFTTMDTSSCGLVTIMMPSSGIDWNSVSEKKKRSIEKAVDALAQKITAKHGRVSSGLKTKGFFNIMRLLQKRGWNETDVAYWKEKGWTGKKRPWRE